MDLGAQGRKFIGACRRQCFMDEAGSVSLLFPAARLCRVPWLIDSEELSDVRLFSSCQLMDRSRQQEIG